MNTLGERIIYCRLFARFQGGQSVSQSELGERVALSLGRKKPITGATVSRWESGEFQPDLDSIREIAHIAGVSPGWLAFGHGGGAEPRALRTADGVHVAVSQIESEKRFSRFDGAVRQRVGYEPATGEAEAVKKMEASRSTKRRKKGKTKGRTKGK